MTPAAASPLFRKVDCLQVPVPDLDAGLAFYRDQLGHELLWRTPTQASLRLLETETELVLQTERPLVEVDLLVASVPDAVTQIVAAGGQVVVPPFAIRIGRCAVVADPFGTQLTLLDMSTGPLVTDAEGTVIGPPGDEPLSPAR